MVLCLLASLGCEDNFYTRLYDGAGLICPEARQHVLDCCTLLSPADEDIPQCQEAQATPAASQECDVGQARATLGFSCADLVAIWEAADGGVGDGGQDMDLDTPDLPDLPHEEVD